jgi:hypothetical protein
MGLHIRHPRDYMRVPSAWVIFAMTIVIQLAGITIMLGVIASRL